MIGVWAMAAWGAEPCSSPEALRVEMAHIRTAFVDPGEGEPPSALVRAHAPEIARQAECLGEALPADLRAEVHMLLAIQAHIDLQPLRRDEHRCAIGVERVTTAVGWGLASADWVNAPCPELVPVPAAVPEPLPVPERERTRIPKAVGLVGLVGGALAIGGGSLLLVQTGRAATSWEAQLSEPGQADWKRQLAPYRAGGVGLLLAGGALAGAGAWITF